MASGVFSFGNQHLATTAHRAFGSGNIFESCRSNAIKFVIVKHSKSWDFSLFELHFTLVRVKALVLTLALPIIITILIVVSERVAIDILVQTGIHFRSKALKRNVANWVCTAGSEELSKEYICLTG